MNDLSLLVHLGLILARTGMLVMLTPVFGGTLAPPMLKIGLMALLALLLAPVVPMPAQLSGVDLPIVLAREVAIGLALAMAVRLLVAAAEFAGHLVGFQIGFSYAATVDPATGVRNSIVSALYANIAVLSYLAIGGHHQLLRALRDSYVQVPIGEGEVAPGVVAAVGEMLRIVLVTGVRLAMPVIAVLLLIEVVVAMLGRVFPALDLMTLGFPLRVLVGMMALGLAIEGLPRVIGQLSGGALELAARTVLAFR